jgi:hypothetical protein
MRYLVRGLGVLLVLVMAACEGSVTEPEAVVFDEDAEFFLAEAGATQAAANPGERVAAAVAHAEAVLERARAFVGDRPSAEVAGLLRQAEVACGNAREALDADRLRAAVMGSIRCAGLAREAAFQAQSERRAGMDARAGAAVAAASDLVAQAAALVTESAPPMAQRVLQAARQNLAEATAALEAGRSLEAMARARLAGALAQRILHALG